MTQRIQDITERLETLTRFQNSLLEMANSQFVNIVTQADVVKLLEQVNEEHFSWSHQLKQTADDAPIDDTSDDERKVLEDEVGHG